MISMDILIRSIHVFENIKLKIVGIYDLFYLYIFDWIGWLRIRDPLYVCVK